MAATAYALAPLAQLDRRAHRRRDRQPLHLTLEQRSYGTVDWSLGGFRLAGLHRVLVPGERVAVLARDPSGSVSGDVVAEVIWTDGDRVGFRFLALAPRLRLALLAFTDR